MRIRFAEREDGSFPFCVGNAITFIKIVYLNSFCRIEIFIRYINVFKFVDVYWKGTVFCVARNCVRDEIGSNERGIFDEVCGNVSDVQFSLQVFLAAQR